MVLESSAKPNLGCQFGRSGLVWQQIQEPLTQSANIHNAYTPSIQTHTHTHTLVHNVYCNEIVNIIHVIVDKLEESVYMSE